MVKLKLDSLNLSPTQKEAINLAKRRLKENFPVESIILYGSVARQQAGSNSDIDILVLTKEKMNHENRDAMADIIFEINLHFGTCISLVVIDIGSWQSGLYQYTQFYEEVCRDEVLI